MKSYLLNSNQLRKGQSGEAMIFIQNESIIYAVIRMPCRGGSNYECISDCPEFAGPHKCNMKEHQAHACRHMDRIIIKIEDNSARSCCHTCGCYIIYSMATSIAMLIFFQCSFIYSYIASLTQYLTLISFN